jgi:hypothetical protein
MNCIEQPCKRIAMLTLLLATAGIVAAMSPSPSTESPTTRTITPCTCRGTAPLAAHEGPWSIRLMIAYSNEGPAWTRTCRVLSDQVAMMVTVITPSHQICLPLAIRQWGQPWPTPTPEATTPVPSPTTSSTPDLYFTPDSGIRMENASNPAASVDDETGTVYLFYEDHSTAPGQRMVATSPDGLNFLTGRPVTDADDPHFPYKVHLPGGKWRKYFFDVQTAQLKSQSSTDGIHYAVDAGVRYRLQPADNGTMGVRDLYVDPSGGVVLLYIGDMGGVNNVRRAYSPPGDNGWTFTFEDGNVMGDADAGGGGNSYVDPKSILLPDGRRRLFTMKQGPLPPQPGKRAVGKIYSFISQDGKSYELEPGVRLQPDDFTELAVWSLNDPVVVRLPDRRYRMYVAALVSDANGTRVSIVSATTQSLSGGG